MGRAIPWGADGACSEKGKRWALGTPGRRGNKVRARVSALQAASAETWGERSGWGLPPRCLPGAQPAATGVQQSLRSRPARSALSPWRSAQSLTGLRTVGRWGSGNKGNPRTRVTSQWDLGCPAARLPGLPWEMQARPRDPGQALNGQILQTPFGLCRICHVHSTNPKSLLFGRKVI